MQLLDPDPEQCTPYIYIYIYIHTANAANVLYVGIAKREIAMSTDGRRNSIKGGRVAHIRLDFCVVEFIHMEQLMAPRRMANRSPHMDNKKTDLTDSRNALHL